MIFFGIFGSVTITIQAYKIWHGKSTKSVSISSIIVFIGYFVAYANYGTLKNDLPIETHGIWRTILWMPVALGCVRYGKPTLRHLLLALLCLALVLTMVVPALRQAVMYVLTVMMIYFIWVQAYTIHKNRVRGRVALSNQIMALTSVVTWVIYGIFIRDNALIIICGMNLPAYSAVIWMWAKYPNPADAKPAVTA